MAQMIENHIAIPGEPALDWNQDATCSRCGDPCFSGEFEHAARSYCETCWYEFHCCLYCDERIFGPEHTQGEDHFCEDCWPIRQAEGTEVPA